MFSFGSGKASHPSLYTGSTISNKSSQNATSAFQDTSISAESLEPAIDGPPSPERIRAYTEQMKRSSIFGNNSTFNSSRTNTISSATSSSRSRDSTYTGTENVSLSRKSSNRSNASSMPSLRPERPESSQGFGSIFSRNGRRRRATNADTLRTSNSSFSLRDMGSEDVGKDHHSNGHRRRHFISEPYNFQHVTHTQQEHLPDLSRASRTELVSEFSAIRASQAPTNGELKGIRAQDLHFDNFSSEALSIHEDPVSRAPSSSPRQRAVLRKSKTPPHQRTVSYAKSHDNMKTPLRSPPPRPPRPLGSPLSPECPIELPVRKSSRTASVLFDSVDPLALTTLERPYQNLGFRRPAPLNLPTPPSPLTTRSEPSTQEYFSSRPVSHALSAPLEEAWPLTASPSGNFGVELDDVEEEDEDEAKRRSRISNAGSDLRPSRSVAEPSRTTREQGRNRPETRMSTTLGPSPYCEKDSQRQKQPLSPGFQIPNDSWESDIDWCYENGAEGDCEFSWVDESQDLTPPATQSPAALDLQVQDDERVYHGRFRPSLLVPSSMDPPELSPASTNTISSSVRTPTNTLRPNHVRVPSQASTFKESHGFTLSPTLLIPSDFQLQLDQETMYNEQFSNDSASGAIFLQHPYNQSVSSVDEGESSTASYRSSNFSRDSARSSSSTRISGPHSRGSQDSAILFSHAESGKEAIHSAGSTISIPELIHTGREQSQAATANDLSAKLAALQLKVTSHPTDLIPSPERPALHHRNKSLHFEHAAPTLPSPSTFHPLLTSRSETFVPSSTLTTVVEVQSMQGPKEHGRKISAPVSPSVREFKGRARAHTASAGSSGPKRRGSYMLFPQV